MVYFIDLFEVYAAYANMQTYISRLRTTFPRAIVGDVVFLYTKPFNNIDKKQKKCIMKA